MSDLPPVSDKAGKRRVRPVSRVADKFEKLRSLSCFTEVHEMLITGWPLAEVAKFIQKQHGEYTDIEEIALIFVLQQYRKSLPPAALLSQTLVPTFAKAAESVRQGLNVLDELTALYQIQMKRIGIDHENEKHIKKLIPTMTQEIREARSILESMQKLKLDLGLDERHLGTIQLAGVADVSARYGKPSVAKVLADPNATRRLVDLADKLLQVSATRSALENQEAADQEDDLRIDQSPSEEFDGDPS